MKPKKNVKRLSLRKATIANLKNKEQQAAKGGYWETRLHAGCYTWHPDCFTQPDVLCPVTDGEECYNPKTDDLCPSIGC